MPKADKPKTLRDLYPDLTDEELEEAETTLDAYLEVVLRIFNRIELEEKEEREKS